MTMLIKWLSFIVLMSALFGAHAQTINAASCSSTDVQNALNSVSADGTTVNIPAGNCTWTTKVAYNQVYYTTIKGQTICTGTPTSSCTENTVITDHTGSGVIDINTAATKSFRMTGMSFVDSNYTNWNGTINIGGYSQQVRIDQINVHGISCVAMQTSGWIYGVMDHSLFTMSGTCNAIRIQHPNWNNDAYPNAGDASWADGTYLGSNKFFFIEDSKFNFGFANDCTQGGRFVFRHNAFNATELQTHPTGGGARHRGCRAWEIYSNTFSNGVSAVGNACFWASSGTGVIWGNTATQGCQNFVLGIEMRYDNATYTQTAPPAAYGYCGTHQTGTASAWDDNSDSTGYPCVDQLGRGIGDLMALDFPNAKNTATNVACTASTHCWPRQALEPIYEWSNTWSGVPGYPGSLWGNATPSQIVQNRDYYLNTQKPGYTPYKYPHPLTGSGGGVPSTPTSLQAVVH